jgi:HSP20 family protein
MDIKKLNPWNWFSREDNQVPATTSSSQRLNHSDALIQLHQDLRRMFNNMLRSFGFPPAAMWQEAIPTSVLRPHIDVVSGDREYVVTVEVPGVEEKDVRLELSPDGALIISGEKRQEAKNKDRDIHRIERTC